MKTLTFSMLVLLAASPLFADDWPRWLGEQGDSVWREKGIVDAFPKDGIPRKWTVPVGLGYSGPAVAGGRVFLFDYLLEEGEVANSPSGRIDLKGKERVTCYDAATGKQVWQYAYDREYKVSYPSGPRCTPTVADGKVYALGCEGDLTCLSAKDGSLVWSKKLTKDYAAKTPIWGFSCHPLVEGDLLICPVGGAETGVVAFDKNTGKEIWRSLSSKETTYCPPVIMEHAGVRQLIIWLPDTLNSLDPATGKSNWSLPLKPNYGMSITAPRQSGDYLFASGIGSTGALYKLNGAKTPEIIWRGKTKDAVYCANSTPFIVDGVIYGNDCQLGDLRAVQMTDASISWSTFEPTTGGERRASHGTAFIIRHEDRFFLMSETGDLIIAKLSPEGYKELSRTHLIDPTNECFGRDVVWSHPAFADKCIFARSDKELICVSLAK